MITVIIPTYNRAQLTADCLNSLHTHGGFDELIVVDNGSSDGTEQMATIRNDHNRGFAAACNQGAQAAQPGTLIFLNNDTIATAGWSEFTNRLIDPSVGICGPKLTYLDGSIQCAGVGIDMGQPPGGEAWNLQFDWADSPADVDAITGACLAIDREWFFELGAFDEGFVNGYEDVDLCLKNVAAGRRCVYDPASVVIHLESQSGPERWHAVAANINRLRDRWSMRP